MKQILVTKQEIGTYEVNTVNARSIYEYLEVKTRFNDWIKRAIRKYDFIENEDYILIVLKNENSNFWGLEDKKEYFVTLE